MIKFTIDDKIITVFPTIVTTLQKYFSVCDKLLDFKFVFKCNYFLENSFEDYCKSPHCMTGNLSLGLMAEGGRKITFNLILWYHNSDLEQGIHPSQSDNIMYSVTHWST